MSSPRPATAVFTEPEARAEVVAAGIRLVDSGLIARTWGNVSARISADEFVITPTGRDYRSLTVDEIVPVRIDDLSHRGDLKPSGERAVHAAIYRDRPDVRFVVHTHQAAASAVSATELADIAATDPLLGERVLVAGYGLPSTKKLSAQVAAALHDTRGHAIIMRNHGAVCFGADPGEVFQAALRLEGACAAYIRDVHARDKRIEASDDDKMRQCALTALARPYGGATTVVSGPLHASERTEGGFVLRAGGADAGQSSGGELTVRFGELAAVPAPLRPEAAVHEAVYGRHASVAAIVAADDADTVTLSRANIAVRPLLDDFAQLVGPRAQTVFGAPDETARALDRAAAVFVTGLGALCCGADPREAEAVRMIVAKNATGYLWSALTGAVRPISRFDAHLMRLVYRRAYSKEISRNVG